MNKMIYGGPFKDYIMEHIELKRAIGYKYSAEESHLKRFDKYTMEKFPTASALTKEIVLGWCSKKTYEAQANQCARASIIRQLAMYMDSIGIKAYIIPKGYYPVEEKYVPHIYTLNELRGFFAETDKCKYTHEFPHRHLIMPIFFRMIYMCGLRVSEARLLKVGDVDLKNGILSINHSKKDISRLVPMTDTLTKRCRNYLEMLNHQLVPGSYFFPALKDKPMTLGNAYKNFRRFLWRTRISHGGRGKGPRIHDFRHTYAVHCLKKWVEQGKDLTVYLPILKTYMGHDSFADTAYYLRLTADVFPDITLKLERKHPEIIPIIEGDKNEAY